MEENNLEKEKNQASVEEKKESLVETQQQNNDGEKDKSNKKVICISTIIGILVGAFLIWVLSFLIVLVVL